MVTRIRYLYHVRLPKCSGLDPLLGSVSGGIGKRIMGVDDLKLHPFYLIWKFPSSNEVDT